MFDQIVILAEPAIAPAPTSPPARRQGQEPLVITREPRLIKICQTLLPPDQSLMVAQTSELSTYCWPRATAVVVGTDMATAPWWDRLSPRADVLIVDLGRFAPSPAAWTGARTVSVIDAVARIPAYLA